MTIIPWAFAMFCCMNKKSQINPWTEYYSQIFANSSLFILLTFMWPCCRESLLVSSASFSSLECNQCALLLQLPRGTFTTMVIIIWNWINDLQILNEGALVLLHANTLGKGMNPSVIPPTMENRRPSWVLWPWLGNQSRWRKTLNSNQLYST